jgi:hypothetical protein
MDKNNRKEGKRNVNPDGLTQHLMEDEETKEFLRSWQQTVTSIFEYDEAIVRCYIFMRKYGIPQRQIRSYGGNAHSIKDLLNVMFWFFEEHEDYLVCARLKKCKPMPSWMINERYQTFASQLEEFYSDATIVMSQKEGFAMIQNILQHASEFFDLDRPYNWVLIWDKIIEHQRQLESLDVGALKVLEAIKDETIQFADREKSLYDIGIREKRFFYRVLE